MNLWFLHYNICPTDFMFKCLCMVSEWDPLWENKVNDTKSLNRNHQKRTQLRERDNVSVATLEAVCICILTLVVYYLMHWSKSW